MAVLASHITVRSCGLCVLSEAVDNGNIGGTAATGSLTPRHPSTKEHSIDKECSSSVFEITVKELSTPLGTPHSRAAGNRSSPLFSLFTISSLFSYRFQII